MQTAARRTSSVVVPRPLKWHGRWAARFAFGLVRFVSATIRYRWEDRTGIIASHDPQPVIYCIWHNRLALCLELFCRYVQSHQPQRRMAAIVSASRDGAFLARVLELYRVQPVRGSSSRRGAQAMLELTTWAEKGYDLAITPDGPRGPRYVIQDGPIGLAQFTGFPIIPVAYFPVWKKCVNSWDRFQIPLPGTRCEVILGAPVTVPSDASDEERERLRKKLQDAMMAITQD
jgi:lysophospholipid acyltransferase (LPLAT)-like uncharacterized protein